MVTGHGQHRQHGNTDCAVTLLSVSAYRSLQWGRKITVESRAVSVEAVGVGVVWGVSGAVRSGCFKILRNFDQAIGGLGWLGVLPLISSRGVLDSAMCIGASGGVFALIGAYAAMFPQRVVYVLLPFPCKVRARTLAVILGVATVAEAVVIQSNVAYAAHLVGGLAGLLYGAVLRRKGFSDDDAQP